MQGAHLWVWSAGHCFQRRQHAERICAWWGTLHLAHHGMCHVLRERHVFMSAVAGARGVACCVLQRAQGALVAVNPLSLLVRFGWCILCAVCLLDPSASWGWTVAVRSLAKEASVSARHSLSGGAQFYMNRQVCAAHALYKQGGDLWQATVRWSAAERCNAHVCLCVLTRVRVCVLRA